MFSVLDQGRQTKSERPQAFEAAALQLSQQMPSKQIPGSPLTSPVVQSVSALHALLHIPRSATGSPKQVRPVSHVL
jgi:hypothetical protein